MSKLNWPAGWARIGRATIDFKFHMTEMLQEERTAIAQGKTRDATFTNSLLRASEELSGKANGNDKMINRGLTEEEIYGNIFVYNFAGHDTTSGTLSWILYLLAVNPEIQGWIAEELKSVFGDDEIQNQEFRKGLSEIDSVHSCSGKFFSRAFSRTKDCRANTFQVRKS